MIAKIIQKEKPLKKNFKKEKSCRETLHIKLEKRQI